MSNAKSKVRMDANAPMQLVRLQCPIGLSAQDLSEAMLESGALFVSVSDGAEGTDAEEPIFAAHSPGAVETHLESWSELMQARQLWSNASLEVGFTADADVEDTLLGAAAIAGLGALPRFSISSIDQRDWVTEVQNNWPPICLPGCLTIQFPWHTAADVAAAREASGSSGADTIDGTDGEEDGVLLTLQPGMAFGTGEHATTQLCCLALRRLLRAEGSGRGCTILDYGSGSGVLAFAALRFGAARAVGVEIDPEALATSVVNAEMNGLADRFVAQLPEEEAATEQYPLVVANILAGTIVELRELLAARVAPGGTLLLSGIWGDEQVHRVLGGFEGTDFGPFEVVTKNGWALLEASRPPSDA